MEKMTDEAPKGLNDCKKRVKDFVWKLAGGQISARTPSRLIEQKWHGDFTENRYGIDNVAKKYEESGTKKILSLDDCNIERIPEFIVNLKGCIKVLDLSNNKKLTSLPGALAVFDSEKDFSVIIKNTPLAEKATKDALTSQDIKKMLSSKIDCVSRISIFVDQLIELNPQMLMANMYYLKRSNSDLDKKDAIKKSITKQYVESFNSSYANQELDLGNLDIQKLPKEIVNLKGCINGINLEKT
jgi:hypothetical protein